MKPLPILIPGAVLLLLVAGWRPTSAARPAAGAAAARGSASGTVAGVYRRGSSFVINQRGAHGALTSLVVRRGARVTAGNGVMLGAGAIRSGDRLVQSGAQLRDTSQRALTLAGVVAFSPLAATDPLVVQVDQTWAVVADFSKGTRYVDRSRETSGLEQLDDGDMVRLSGVYDAALGEMTSVGTVTRLGPVRHGGKGG